MDACTAETDPQSLLLAAYRGLWSRIPQTDRLRMENIMLQWAPEDLCTTYRQEMAARESSPDWKPSLGSLLG